MRNFHNPGRSTAYGANGMAATSSPPATLAAIDVLRAGGNAVDAAITASAVLCVTEPHMTAIGGDCFALVGEPDGKVTGLNGSGRASVRADADWLKRSGLSEIAADSVHAVTVPGAIDAWDRLLERFGSMMLGEALQPAIRLAEQGVPTQPRVAHDWADNLDRLKADEGGAKHLLFNGRTPREGEVMRYPALAETLKTIARDGRDGFYKGRVAEDIVSHLAKRGGLLTLDDFAAAEGNFVEPISTAFGGREVLEIPPNGQGITALMALNALKRFDLARHGPDSLERRHLEIEAVKLAWVLRNRHIADPSQVAVPVEAMLSEATADMIAGLIDPGKAFDGPESLVAMPGSHTIYLTVVDHNRLAVSFINSVYDDFGSGIITPATGITLQSRGKGFVTDPTHPNCIAPGKRPLHTILPAMVMTDGLVEMPFGVMGGNYQPMGHVAVMVNRFVYGMDPQEAIDLPRAFHDKGIVGIEDGVSDAVAAGLAALGHAVERRSDPWGGGQAIAIDRQRGVLVGGSDPRKDGFALGY
jgi:gamma-glutamyltranspeptidase/glutathione hydrolase